MLIALPRFGPYGTVPTFVEPTSRSSLDQFLGNFPGEEVRYDGRRDIDTIDSALHPVTASRLKTQIP
ncbi:hypothetical protein A5732_13675 [Mycobacterium colombiense]|nr:hypothetical protein A5732_13675 [Mycobacterium colombiense]